MEISAASTTSSDENVEREVREARRTAFVARFIVLREAKRSRAHRKIEKLKWDRKTSAEELAEMIRSIFRENGDNLIPVERDIVRALAHANRSINYFIKEYYSRATDNFEEALMDYQRSNTLLFGDDDKPKLVGWRLKE